MTLYDIAPGDTVLYHHHLTETTTIETVTRVSQRQVMIGDKNFRRKDGLLAGSGTGRRHRASDWIEVVEEKE